MTAEDLSHRYLWQANAVDQLMADEQITTGEAGYDQTAAGNVVLPLGDHLGTIRDLATFDSTTGTTTVANHRVYDSYGNLKSQTNAAVDCLFGFTGRPLDKATGLQNNGERWYDSAAGRWMSKDPIGFNGKDANPYRYCGNGVTDARDPSGLEIEEVPPPPWLNDKAKKALVDEYQRLQMMGLLGDDLVSGLVNKALDLTHGNVDAALNLVYSTRNCMGGGNDDWACADHYLQSLALKSQYGLVGSISATMANAGYTFLKSVGAPVSRDVKNIPPSPPTWRQWRWGNGGAW